MYREMASKNVVSLQLTIYSETKTHYKKRSGSLEGGFYNLLFIVKLRLRVNPLCNSFLTVKQRLTINMEMETQNENFL